MADKSKGPVVLLIILLIVAVVAAVLGFIGLQKEKENNAILSEKIEQLEVKRRSAEKQIADLKVQLDSLKTEIALQQAKVQELGNQLTVVNNELMLEKEAKDSAVAELSRAKADIEALSDAKSNLEAELKAGKADLDNLKNQLNAIETAKQGLEEKLKDSSAKPKDAQEEAKSKDVQLDKIVVAQPSGSEGAGSPTQQSQEVAGQSQAQPALEGKVLVVNKEYDFIVINLGNKDNIATGDTFEISRKDKNIGEVRVEEVRDTMSVATPVTKDMIKQIKEDDRALRK